MVKKKFKIMVLEGKVAVVTASTDGYVSIAICIIVSWVKTPTAMLC